MPITHGPGWTSATAAGPALHFSLPSFSSVAVGKLIEGPMPQVTGAAVGRREVDGVVDVAEAEGRRRPQIAFGQLGQARRDVRQIDQRHDRAADQVHRPDTDRDHRLDVEHVGVSSSGPTPKKVLFWNGRLIIAATGFCAALARSA